MRAELLTIGSELTRGATINTNAVELARGLGRSGITSQRHVTVGDERPAIERALREALPRCDLLITTGGLGPTFDDITMEAIAAVIGRSLAYVPVAAARIRRFYHQSHRQLQQAALRQAYLPVGGEVLPNPIGTAPGLWVALPRPILVALPGVPSEMRAMWEQHVLPRLARLPRRDAIETLTLRTVGVVELQLQHLLHHLRVPSSVQVGLYPHLRAVDIGLTATAPSRAAARAVLSRLEGTFRRRLGAALYGRNDETLEGVVGALLVVRRQTVAVAESCTGGLLSDCITDVSGSSRYFLGAVVAYHNTLKAHLLGVPPQVLAREGAVSGPVAAAMARGVRRVTGADVGLSVTGIAGPTGGTTRKPVGMVYLGLSDGHRTLHRGYQFVGDRNTIKAQTAQTALDLLRRHLLPTNHTSSP